MTDDFSDIFTYLFPIPIPELVDRVNLNIDKHNLERSAQLPPQSRRSLTSEAELYRWFAAFMFFSVHIGAGVDEMFSTEPVGMEDPIDLKKKTGISQSRYEILTMMLKQSFKGDDEEDKYCRANGIIEGFNKIARTCFHAPVKLVIDESLAWMFPRAGPNRTANLPNMTFLADKPKNNGCMLKSAACANSGLMHTLEIQRGKEGEKERDEKYLGLVGARTACTLRIVESTYGVDFEKRVKEIMNPTQPAGGDNNDHVNNNDEDVDRPIPYPFLAGVQVIADGWFASALLAAILSLLGLYFVGTVKTCSGGSPKRVCEELFNKPTRKKKPTEAVFPAGTNVVLEGTMLGAGLTFLLTKYSRYRCACIIGTKGAFDTDIKAPGSACKQYYLDKDGTRFETALNRSPLLLAYLLYMGAVDRHNQSRQGDLNLEGAHKTEDGFWRIITTVIGMVVTNCFLCMKNKDSTSSMSIKTFNKILCAHLVKRAIRLERGESAPGTGTPSPVTPSPSTPSPVTPSPSPPIHRFASMNTGTDGKRTQLTCVVCTNYFHTPKNKTSFHCVDCAVPVCKSTKGVCFRIHATGMSKEKMRKHFPNADVARQARASLC